MRDYSNFDECVNSLQRDVYPQPPDDGHTEWAYDSLRLLPEDVDTVLDVGCGQGFLRAFFEAKEIIWNGITLGISDFKEGKRLQNNKSGLFLGDYTFTKFQDEMFDLVYARHALEHSPFPIITLMEWHRIARNYLLLVAPAPEYWNYHGQNHYSVANEDQLWWWLARAGWKIIHRDYLRTDDELFVKYYRPEEKDRTKAVYPGSPTLVEYRYLCEKVEPEVK